MPFKVLKVTKLDDLKDDSDVILPDSDYSTITPEGNFIQLKYFKEEKKKVTEIIEPGLYQLKKSMSGYYSEPACFIQDKILSEIISTEAVEKAVDSFFNKLDVYAELEIEIPKRGALLWGPPGSGKTTSLIKVSEKYVAQGDVAIIICPTRNPGGIKDYFESVGYADAVKKLIIIMEDLGGAEVDAKALSGTHMAVDSEMLSLLDNSQKTFKLPVYIIATTNFPENYMENIVNRPGRLDDKIHVGYLRSNDRRKLLEFISRGNVSGSGLEEIEKDKYSQLTTAHIKEAYIRSRLNDVNLESVLNDILKEIEQFKNAFQKAKESVGIKMGFGLDEDEDY